MKAAMPDAWLSMTQLRWISGAAFSQRIPSMPLRIVKPRISAPEVPLTVGPRRPPSMIVVKGSAPSSTTPITSVMFSL